MSDGLESKSVVRQASWLLQSREEIAVENALYFRFLRTRMGAERADAWIKDYLGRIENEIAGLGEPGDTITREVRMLEVAGGLTFWPYLAKHKSVQHQSDPINYIFWDYGTVFLISDLLRNGSGGWAPTNGITLWALIDDTKHGGGISWKRFDEQLRKGPVLRTSTHVRLYGGSCTCNHGKENYALAGVHEEKWQPLNNHVVTDWNNPRNDLESDLQAVPGAVTSTVRVNLNTKGPFQNVTYDGEAAYTQLARPAWLVTI